MLNAKKIGNGQALKTHPAGGIGLMTVHIQSQNSMNSALQTDQKITKQPTFFSLNNPIDKSA